MLLHPPAVEAVPVITISSDEQTGSGSGDFANLVPIQADFPENEVIGQLFAYMLSDNEVILGTRSSSVTNQRLAVGISPVAAETYLCVAENANAQDNITADIKAQGNIFFKSTFSYEGLRTRVV